MINLLSVYQKKLQLSATHLSHLQKLSNAIHARQEFLVQIQSIPALLLVHIEIFLQQVDDGIVVASEQSNQIAK